MEKQYIPAKEKQTPKMNLVAKPVSTPEKNQSTEITPEKKEEKIESKLNKPQEKIIKKTESAVYGKDLGISTKHSISICRAIRGKKIDESIYLLEEIVKMKKALPMKGELPHRKGMAGGRYPIKAAEKFIKLLKQLSANASVNGLEPEKARIECRADLASRPYKRFGSERFKRTHVILKLKEIPAKKIKEK